MVATVEKATVWKFAVESLSDLVHVYMPKGAKVLSVGMQGSWLTFWALVDPDAKDEQRQFRVCGTGHPVHPSEIGAFIGTVFERGFVWHVFEAKDGGG